MQTKQFDITPTISYEQGYAIRGIAMLTIIFAHAMNEYEFYSSTTSVILLIPMFGTLGSSLFFFMSGYGIYCSLYKKKDNSNISNLLKHLKKIITPIIIVYIINSIILPQTLSYNDITISHRNAFTLSLPEGTDLWFIKIIIFNYITTFLLFKLSERTDLRLIYLTITQVALVSILYMCKAPGYWYISNLCFVFGALHAIHPIFKRNYIATSILLFAGYYICIINNIVSAPIQIIGNIAFCIIMASIFNNTNKWPGWLQFIGKNSLLYYLLGIPVMWLIPSNKMYPIFYFIANLVFTSTTVITYKRFEKAATNKEKID